MPAFLFAAAALGSLALPPDHVVIVVEENHSYTDVIGSPDAPYINALAQQGVLLTGMYGVTHPSQPNYLHLFSGSDQGVIDNAVPAAAPFSTPNLGASLRAAGYTFIGYGDSLPAPGSLIDIAGPYARKHNPWTHWQADSPGPNQLPPTTNLPFTMFPSDFTQLPTVAMVVPDLDHDMHDGTIAEADQWLQANLGAYASWAMSHNSLLIVVWDEDSFVSRNHIPAIVVGPTVRPGIVESGGSLHHVLRTVEDLYALPHAGAAADCAPIPGLFTDRPPVATITFAQGLNGYASAVDTWIEAALPDATHASETPLVADGSPLRQILIKFGGLFGPGAVPDNATVVAASLILTTGAVSSDQSADAMSAHAMRRAWSASDTWNTLGNGVSTDNIEAATLPDYTWTPRQLDASAVFDVTRTVQAWADGSAPNQGWLIRPSGSDGWRPTSAEGPADVRPRLVITYTTPACDLDLNQDGNADQDDVAYLINVIGGGANPAAIDPDFNHDGNADQDDVLALINAIGGGGCP